MDVCTRCDDKLANGHFSLESGQQQCSRSPITLQMRNARTSKIITCSATGEANNTEVLWLWWLLEHEISTSEQHAACQIQK